MIIKESKCYDYLSDSNINYPRCAWIEAHIDACDDGWQWYAGEVVDPLAGGKGELTFESARLKGVARSKDLAKKRALASFKDLI